MANDQNTLYPQLTWWIGVVENRFDPLKLNRFQVRIYSIHSPDRSIMPTEDLMWSTALMPTISAGVSGVGISPSKLMQGSTVMGMFLDGERAQQPVILGTIVGAPTWTEKERKRLVENTPLAEIKSIFNDDIEEDYDSLPDDGSLKDMLMKRFEFEGPHIVIKPNLDYEDKINVSPPSFGGMKDRQAKVFRYCAATFLSNINYLCVSKNKRVGKYQFTTDFLQSQGLLDSEDIFDHSSWISEDAPSLTDFLHAYELQEELFVTWVDELGVSGDLKESFGDAMVGLIVKDGLNNWKDDEVYVDDEGRDTVDAFMKGLVAAYLAEEEDE